MLTAYGVWFGVNVLSGIISKNQLWGAKFRSVDTDEIFTAGYTVLFQYLLNRYPIFVFLVILCTIMCLSLSLFFTYHMYLVKLGFTTNEKIKKSCLEDDIEIAIEKRMRSIKPIKSIEDPLDKQRYIDIKEDIAELKEKLKTVKSINYSKGFVKNIIDIIQQ